MFLLNQKPDNGEVLTCMHTSTPAWLLYHSEDFFSLRTNYLKLVKDGPQLALANHTWMQQRDFCRPGKGLMKVPHSVIVLAYESLLFPPLNGESPPRLGQQYLQQGQVANQSIVSTQLRNHHHQIMTVCSVPQPLLPTAQLPKPVVPAWQSWLYNGRNQWLKGKEKKKRWGPFTQALSPRKFSGKHWVRSVSS